MSSRRPPAQRPLPAWHTGFAGAIIAATAAVLVAAIWITSRIISLRFS